jgi:hypothetical protein
MFSRITACVRSFVRVSQHVTCSTSIRSVQWENGSGGSSPGCGSAAPQSIESR